MKSISSLTETLAVLSVITQLSRGPEQELRSERELDQQSLVLELLLVSSLVEW